MSQAASPKLSQDDFAESPDELQKKIEQTRTEIAALRHPKAPVDRFDVAKNELGEVVEATEAASSVIFGYVEQAEEIAGDLLDRLQDEANRAKVQEIVDTITKVYEALGFQDLTGQRMNKVRQTIEYVEDRLSNLTETWGAAEIERLPVPDDTPADEDEKLLNGPRRREEEGVNQADIDALFD